MTFNPINAFNNYLFSKDLHHVMMGRVRDRSNFKLGRFTQKQVQSVYKNSLKLTEKIEQSNPIPPSQSMGASRNLYLAATSLGLYRALLQEVKNKDYAIELASDVCWLSFERSTRITRFLTKIWWRNPKKQLAGFMKLGLTYPFSRPDYDWKIIPCKDVFAVDFYQCPIHNYFKGFGEEEMHYFRQNWCTLDFSIGEVIVKGGRYERTKTLSDGDSVCNMKFFSD